MHLKIQWLDSPFFGLYSNESNPWLLLGYLGGGFQKQIFLPVLGEMMQFD